MDFFANVYKKRNILIYSIDTNEIFRANNWVMQIRFSPFINQIRTKSFFKKLNPFINKTALFFLNSSDGKKQLDDFDNNWNLINGHFNADKFDTQIQNPFRTIIFREPLERTISHFRYWEKSKGILNHRINIPYDQGISFRDFALNQQLVNFQSKSLGGMSIGDFDVVGITENMNSFVSDFLKKRGILEYPIEIRKLNESSVKNKREGLGIDPTFIHKFTIFNAQDYECWEKAKEMITEST